MSKHRKNGPVSTYRFKSTEHQALYDAHKISFDEATEKVKKQYMMPITQYWLRTHTKNVQHYIYANYLHPECDKFLVVNEGTGEAWPHRYMMLDSLWTFVTDPNWTVYLTNI